jgi:hypothetical protein
MKSKSCIYYCTKDHKLKVGHNYNNIEFPDFIVKKTLSRGCAHGILRSEEAVKDLFRVYDLERMYNLAHYNHKIKVNNDEYYDRLKCAKLRKERLRKFYLVENTPAKRIYNDFYYAKYLKSNQQ